MLGRSAKFLLALPFCPSGRYKLGHFVLWVRSGSGQPQSAVTRCLCATHVRIDAEPTIYYAYVAQREAG
jgi:hypothetical protein